ncbi:MAG TPA: pirin family protein [Ramlibacter sp.]|nr:pirin family protein [Ramlibacter sp.]
MSARYEVRRERGLLQAGWLRARFSFSFGGYVHPQGDRFGPVLALNEDEVQPGTGFPMHPHRDLEIFMLPLQGAIAHADSLGHEATVRAGQVLMMRAGSGIRHSQFNASDTELDRHLQLWIEPEQAALPPKVQLADIGEVPAGRWRLVAGAGGSGAPLTVAQQASVLLGVAEAGQPLPLALAQGQAAYLHTVAGSSTAHLPGARTERLGAGDALAVEALAGTALLRPDSGTASFLLVTFASSLLLRNRTSADVRVGR